MSNNRLAALKKQWKTEEENKKKNSYSNKNGDIYPFWNMEINQKAVVRFLPDANLENPYGFYIDKLEHTLSLNGKDRKVVCRSMFGQECPICDLSRKYYKDEGKETKDGKYYYRKKVHLARILVLDDPLPPNEETKEKFTGKVCIIQIGYQLMDKIKAELNNIPDDEDFDFLDYDVGYNYNINKTASGQYGKYDVASAFDRRPSAIPAQYRDIINLVDLATLLPKDPGFDTVQAQLSAHINGEEYDDGSKSSDEDGEPSAPKTTTNVASALDSVQKAVANRVAEAAVASSYDDEDDEDNLSSEEVIAMLRKNRTS